MSLAHKSPIVEFLVYCAIREIYTNNLKFTKKEIIDSSIVPKVHPHVHLSKGFQESVSVPIKPVRILPPINFHPAKKEKPTPQPKKQPPIQEKKNKLPGFQESIFEKDKIVSAINSTKIPDSMVVQKQFSPERKAQETKKIIEKPIQTTPQVLAINLFQSPPNYGKMNIIIKDPLVNLIECEGPNKPLIVTKGVQKQKTNIFLTKQEIQMLLNNVSAKTKIPLLTGVFRVSWDNFIINAIISDNIEPRFVIKKEA